jgi:hypothetical protein
LWVCPVCQPLPVRNCVRVCKFSATSRGWQRRTRVCRGSCVVACVHGAAGQGPWNVPSAAASKVRNYSMPEMGLAGNGSGLMDLVLWIWVELSVKQLTKACSCVRGQCPLGGHQSKYCREASLALSTCESWPFFQMTWPSLHRSFF